MKQLFFLYGLFSYVTALVGQTAFILYLTQYEAMPRTVFMPQSGTLWFAVAVNIALVLLWAIQHSVMARGWFKRKITRLLPEVIERSTYVLLSGIVLISIVLFWQPIDGIVWDVENRLLRTLLWGGFVFGWVFSVVASFVINHFELFGLQQVYLYLRDRSMPVEAFSEKLFYRFIRHPIQLGVLMGLWITPVMNYGHLMLSVLMTIYIFIGLYFEEKDLVTQIGKTYVEYKQKVGMMFPRARR